MLEISAVLDQTGLLRRCEIRGHANAGPAGSDIVCAAVSALSRTALAVLSGREGILARGEAPERGAFLLETEAKTESGRAFLAAAGEFLLAGLESVAREYPGNCRMAVRGTKDDKDGG